MDNKKNKNVISVLMVLTIIFTLAGGTLAFWRWDSTTNTGVTFTITPNYSCSVDGGENISSEDIFLAPTKNCNGPNVIKRELTVSTKYTNTGFGLNMTLWLEANGVDPVLANSKYINYKVSKSGTDCNQDVIESGTFADLSNGAKTTIFNNLYRENTTEKYYLYIWMGHQENNNDLQNKNLRLSLGGKCEQVEDTIKPTLDPGMIPVTIDSDGTVRTVSANDPNWYNYSNKEWANVVLVNKDKTEGVENSKSRSEYLSSLSNNVIVAEEDILAYYVWIPRYKYKLWTTDPTKTTSPQTIDIVFESESTEFSNGTRVGEYRTHPAFWWDDNSNGIRENDEMIAGIWVGKFLTNLIVDETTLEDNPACDPYGSVSDCNIDQLLIRIIPDKPLYFANWDERNSAIYQFAIAGGIYDSSNSTVTFTANENNEFGINTTNTKTNGHSMKNVEYGAVLYLSHSSYGINQNISYGNAFDIYNTKESYSESTTGNITGIFEMGNYIDVMARTSTYSNYWFNIESKYEDIYSVNTILHLVGEITDTSDICTIETCGGHALYETKGWYGENFYTEGDGTFERWGYGLNNHGEYSDSHYHRSVLITNVNNN